MGTGPAGTHRIKWGMGEGEVEKWGIAGLPLARFRRCRRTDWAIDTDDDEARRGARPRARRGRISVAGK